MSAAFMNEFEHLQVPLEEIISATNNFCDESFIGGGGFGKVYKGALARYKDQSTVAFKRLDSQYGQGGAEFLKEITLLSRYTHKNLISLLGFCNQQNEMILVYEHASRGSLDRHLGSAHLTWTQRLKICLDAAKGLNHLHDPRETHQRVIHCDIKSANILLDDQWNAKVADFGLSKIGPANQQNSMIVTNALGTYGYCDPEFMKTYTLKKESDVYSFGVVLFEVLCGRLCFEKIKINGRLNVLVSRWKKSYQEKKLEEIIFQDLMPKMDLASLEAFSDIAFQCLKDSREQRPKMSLVVQRLETALNCQELSDLRWIKEFEEIVNSAASPLIYKSPQELEVLLSKGLFVNGGKTWFSLNDNGEHHETISITECLVSLKDQDYTSQNSSDCNSRFGVGCYSTHGKKFQARVITQFLSPLITYTVNLIFKFRGRKEEQRPRYLPLKYKYEGETKLLIVDLVDKKEDEWLIAKLHQFTSDGKTIDLNFLFEDHSYCNGLEIESIQFQPMKNVEHHKVLDLQYEEILMCMEPLVIYKSVAELKVLLSKGVLLNEGKTWFSLNDNGEHHETISITACLVPLKDEDYSFQYSSDCNSRFGVGCYSTHGQKFQARVIPQFLSPLITYTVNLIFKFRGRKKEQRPRYLPLKYKYEGETKLLMVDLLDKKEEEWLIAKLHQFTSDGKTVLLNFLFEDHSYCNGLEIESIQFQPMKNVEHHKVKDLQYEEILKCMEPLVIYKCVEELKVLLSKGVLLNEGKTWFSLDDEERNCKMISMAECLLPSENGDDGYQFSSQSNSRFEVGCYSTHGKKFKTCIRSQFLSPMVTYRVNLVFKFMDRKDVKIPGYLPLKYKIKGETKISIVYLADNKEDERLIAKLYEFTNDGETIDLKFSFEDHSYCNGLVIEGIEFQPMENVEHHEVLELHYQEILQVEVVPLMYRSVDDVKALFSKGVLLNGGKKWFSINENGEHTEFISIADCLVPEEGESYEYSCDYNSRFPVGAFMSKGNFKTILKTQFLSPHITYTVNLVFKFGYEFSSKQEHIPIKYRLEGQGSLSTIIMVYKREDNWWTAELCQFTSDVGPTFSLYVIFQDFYHQVEGIEFQPLEKVERQVSEDEKPTDMQLPISELINDDETYWKQKLPNDYKYIIKQSKDKLKWTTKKELYSIFSKGFLIVNNRSFFQRLFNTGDQQWFSLDKRGKTCLTLSLRRACTLEGPSFSKYPWQSLPESRFGEVLVLGIGFEIIILLQNGRHVLSPQTRYASYLVYGLPEHRSRNQGGCLMKVSATTGSAWEDWHVFFDSPQTPVVRPKVGENTHNPPAKRPKVEDLPQQRSDGWMEVKLYEFRIDTASKGVIPKLKLENVFYGDSINWMMIQCIEIRQI